MKVTLTSTEKIVDLNNGVQARVWQGETASGTPVVALIPRIAVDREVGAEKLEEFARELEEHDPPRPAATDAWPMRLVL